MIIIIEGPDGAGKTTLANTLAKQTGYSVAHFSFPKTEDEKATMMKMYLQAVKESKDIIFDRCWYSEMVYGPIMRGASAITYPNMYELERQLAKQGAVIIYCTNEPEKLWNACTKRGEDFVKDASIHQQICEGFDELMGVPHIVPVVKHAY